MGHQHFVVASVAFVFVLSGGHRFETAVAADDERPLLIGWAEADITPDRPVALVGQMHKRISTKARDPLTATALALETKSTDGSPATQAIMVSCDLASIAQVTQQNLRKAVASRLEDFDVRNLFLNATHTHTAPQQVQDRFRGLYDVSGDEGVMTATEYREFLVARLSDSVVDAWQNRKPGGLSWGLGQAVVGHNRRAVYFDGRAAMYGQTDKPSFDRIEGYEDHGVGLLFFWNPQKKLTGMIVNIACPAQETEGLSVVSADFWHDVRVELRKRLSKDLFVLPQCAAAGDISPHLMFRKKAEQIMMKRSGRSRREEIASRIADAVERVLPLCSDGIKSDVVFHHTVAEIDLPLQEPPKPPFYETDDASSIEIHVLRLDDVAIATNPFELYLDYGVRMAARSKSVLTFTVQLSGKCCGYLPTEQAVAGGGYSAVKFIVGPEGGRVLVDETVKYINELWP